MEKQMILHVNVNIDPTGVFITGTRLRTNGESRLFKKLIAGKENVDQETIAKEVGLLTAKLIENE
jgi:hypothetical protein